MGYLDKVTRQRSPQPRRTILYATHGFGKSTWGAQWPDPIFVQTEDGLTDPKLADVPAFPVAETLLDAWQPVIELGSPDASHGFKTLVVDTVDWLERLMHAEILAKHTGKDTLKEIGWNGDRAYEEAAGMLRGFLKACDACKAAGMHVVILSHCSTVKVKPPDGEAYTKYAPAIQAGAASMLQEWADEVLFGDYVTHTTTKDANPKGEGGRKVGIGSGDRLLRTEERPAWYAKNRLGLPAELPFDFSSYEPFLQGTNTASNG